MTNILKSGWLKRAGSAVVALPTARGLIAAVSILGATQAYAVPTFFAGTGNNYEYINQTQTWSSAKSAAEALSFGGVQGHLVTIFSQAENDFVRGILSPQIPAWLGATDEVEFRLGSFSEINLSPRSRR